MDAHAAFLDLFQFVRSELIVTLAALAGIVAYQMMNGAINLKGIFSKNSGEFDPSRVQMLFSTLVVAGGYLAHPAQISVASNVGMGAGALIGGSNILYLVQKMRLLASR